MNTTTDAMKAKATLDKMRASLAAWLKFRKSNDDVASGKVPGKIAPAVLRQKLIAQRAAYEQPLADQLHQLLSEVMDSQSLPDPDLDEDPDAAAKLAAIAVLGRAEGERAAPLPQGMWSPGTIWPLALIGGLAVVAMFGISSAADVAKEHERIQCVQSGACTDSGFWLKAAAVAGLGYVGWRMYGHHLSPKHGGR
jgi:hypothetical protein